MPHVFILVGIAVANVLVRLSPGRPSCSSAAPSPAVCAQSVLLPDSVAIGLDEVLIATLWAAAAFFGVATSMTRLATLHGLIQLAGAAYLIWRGPIAWFIRTAGTPRCPIAHLRAVTAPF